MYGGTHAARTHAARLCLLVSRGLVAQDASAIYLSYLRPRLGAGTTHDAILNPGGFF